MPQSWGGLYSGAVWSKFLEFEKAVKRPGDTPFALSNRWPYEVSWKKILLRYMYAKGIAVLYPPLRLGGVAMPTSLSGDKAVNSKGGHAMSGSLMISAPPRVDSYLYYEMYGKEHLQPRDAARSDVCNVKILADIHKESFSSTSFL